MFRSSLPVPLRPGVSAAAVVLPVQTVFLRQLYGPFISVLLLEITEKEIGGFHLLFPQFLLQPEADLVQPLRIFIGTDGKRRGEAVIALLRRILCGPSQPEFVAVVAPAAPFRFQLPSPDDILEFLRSKGGFHQLYFFCKWGLLRKPDQLRKSFPVLLFRVHIRIIEEYGDIKMSRQYLQTVAAAGTAAGMEKQPVPITLIQLFFKPFVKILHILPIVILTKSFFEISCFYDEV